jgi:hypothetical protein
MYGFRASAMWRSAACYYPGFTFEGLGEPLAILALAVLLASIARSTPEFWLIALALAAEAAAHLLYWLLIVPMNRAWLAGETHTADRAALLDLWSGATSIARSPRRRRSPSWPRRVSRPGRGAVTALR